MTVEQKQRRIEKTPLGDQLYQQDKSLVDRYREKVLGPGSMLQLLQYELCNLLSNDMAGAPGYLLRKMAYKRLFRQVGSGVVFGRGMAIRHPGRITLGDRVAIDDYVMLDAWGAGDEGITIGNDVIISRNCIIQSKMAPITIGARTDIGSNTTLSSVSGISIGESVLIAGNCYIGGGRYVTDRTDVPMMDQGMITEGSVVIEDDSWLGAGVIVVDGVHIGRGSVVGAGAVVVKNLPQYSIAPGVASARAIAIRGRD